jgi:YVTN family beta-propeller protein
MRPLRQTTRIHRLIPTALLAYDMFCFPTRLVLGLICWLSASFVANNVHAAFGDIVAQYSFSASSFVMSPTQPLMYATIPSWNSVAIINTNTLVVESTVFVGSNPVNLAFSPDGSKAYIANSGSNFVAVFNTQTRRVVNSFLLPEPPQDVVFGSSNRLWVLGQSQIFQIDATTGASTGPSITNSFVNSGSLEISPDRNTLYYADLGAMYKYDVSGSTPVLRLQTPFSTVWYGLNENLTLSHNGRFICYGSGQNNGYNTKFRTSDFAALGSFNINTGSYPQALAFSPDDSLVYASVDYSGIKVFNANTFLPVGTISDDPEVSGKLAVDSTGRYLFAGYTAYFSNSTGTIVFDTGVTNTGVWYLNNNVFTSPAFGPYIPAGWQVVGVADFNRDGHPDYLLFNPATRQTAIWYLSGVTFVGGAYGPTLPAGWKLVATGNFNNDGRPDYVLYNASSHQTAVWYLNNNVYVGGAYGPTLPAGWSLVGVADFNIDGKPDYLLFNLSTRQSAIWYLFGTTYAGGAYGPAITAGYNLIGAADFNGNGKPDYLLYNPSTQRTAIWYMNNNVHVSGSYGPTLPTGWTLTDVADFNGDGHPDFLLFH